MERTPPRTRRLVGWLVKDKGQRYLATARGWFLLEDPPSGLDNESPAVVEGHLTSPTTIRVVKAETAPVPGRETVRRPRFAVTPVPHLYTASDLRLHAHKWLREQDFAEISFPVMWSRSEEYGTEELRARHSKLGDIDLRLLQSAELPIYDALAGGLGDCFSFGRCFRLETDPAALRSGQHLMEFEQLLLGMSFVSMGDCLDVVSRLVRSLAAEAGIDIAPEEFVISAPPGAPEVEGHTAAEVEDMVVFTLPGPWPIQARKVFLERLAQMGVRVTRIDGHGDEPAGLPGEEVRLAIEVPEGVAAKVRRVLDIATSHIFPSEDVSSSVSLQLNPTWNVYPPFHWEEGEGEGSRYPIRSITARRVLDANGLERSADAELYLGGVEIAHARAYAGREEFLANLRSAGITDSEERFGYLLRSLEQAPPGMVSVAIGWERLMSVLLGQSSARDAQLYPRNPDGTLSAYGPEQHRSV